MDTSTLRLTFAIVAIVMLMLFVLAAYLPTRAPFPGWWSLALLLFMLGSLAYLADGTGAQVVLNPAGNVCGVAGTEAAWCASRSLHGRRPPWWLLAITPVTTAIAGAVDHPDHNRWAGGGVFLGLMAIGYALTAWEMRLVSRHPSEAAAEDGAYRVLTLALALASLLLALVYLARLVVYAVAGPFSHLFTTWFGSGPTTLVILVVLVVVSFSMASLTTQQQLHDLRRSATHDDLTGLLNRQEFLRRAALRLQELRRAGSTGTLVMVDLDYFKTINDRYGHAVGDQVLHIFGQTCRAVLGPDDIYGRLGGEEFALLLAVGPDAAERVTSAIGRMLRATPVAGLPTTTASFGLAATTPGEDLASTLERADAALYRAKAAGRDRTAR